MYQFFATLNIQFLWIICWAWEGRKQAFFTCASFINIIIHWTHNQLHSKKRELQTLFVLHNKFLFQVGLQDYKCMCVPVFYFNNAMFLHYTYYFPSNTVVGRVVLVVGGVQNQIGKKKNSRRYCFIIFILSFQGINNKSLVLPLDRE